MICKQFLNVSEWEQKIYSRYKLQKMLIYGVLMFLLLLLLLWKLMFKNTRNLSFSISHVNLILGCLEFSRLNKVLTWFSDFSRTDIIHITFIEDRIISSWTVSNRSICSCSTKISIKKF